jgi:hypothetical protein
MKKRTFLKRGILGAGAMLFSGKAFSLEYYPNPSGSKWAVLYGTWCGSSRDAAVWISEGMDGIANVFDVRENPDLSEYEHLIIGGAIRSQKTTPLLQEYIGKNQEIIKSRIRGYFAVCGNRMQPVTPELENTLIDNHFAILCGVEKLPGKVFLGRITFGLMEPEVRPRMEAMSGMYEYDNLKRAECMEFGKELLKTLIP